MMNIHLTRGAMSILPVGGRRDGAHRLEHWPGNHIVVEPKNRDQFIKKARLDETRPVQPNHP